MSTILIPVKTTSATYSVEIGNDILPQIGARLDKLLSGALVSRKQKLFVVTSPEIWALHGPQLISGFPHAPVLLEVPAGEQYKLLTTVERLLESLADNGADRDSVLLAFGGGVIGDITGFLAAIYMRGIRYVGVPTTLLAQVDSSLGGKTGVNLAAGKNLVGAFHHPIAVYSDTATLATLPEAELRAGLQESVKAGIIRNRGLFDFLDGQSAAVLSRDATALTSVVAESVRVKAEVVAADELESGLRMLLNLGHTLGHAIEAATGYKHLLHGEAVAWGMLAAIQISQDRNIISGDDAATMRRVINAYGPLKHFTADVDTLVSLTAKDKKNRSGVRSFVLPTGIGTAMVVRDVSETELHVAAQKIIAEAASLTVRA